MTRRRAPNAPIRVAFCHYTADVAGGSDRAVFDLATHLPRDRFLPLMILKNGDPMAEAYRAAGIEVTQVHLVPPRRALELGKQLAFFLSYGPSVIQVARAMHRLRADLVHVNTIYNLQGPVAARLSRLPLVWHVREIPQGRRLDNIMVGLVRRLATRAVAISGAVADTLASCGDRLRIVPDGIDLAAYASPADGSGVRRAFGLSDEQPVVTVVGRLEPWKGQHVLVEAIPSVLEAFPGAHFLFVGGPAVNKPDYLPQLEARCRELGVDGHVTFTGIRKDIPEVLAASQVLVLPTCTAEPFGLTVVEAMAARCPVVATAAGGPLQTVVDGETGWLVPPNDAPALGQKIRHVLAHPEEAHKMGERGRERALEQFSIERVARDMATLFEETVSAVTERSG